MNNKKKTISLVLGSGGARGYAHIGVIEELLDYGYEIKSISGSSMGALIGALYACGKLEAYKKWVSALNFLDVVKLLDFSFKGNGLIQGGKVFHVIEELIGDIMIEDLPIIFTAVATDIMEQKEVWIRNGSLIDAVRASVAIPTIFTPRKIGNRYLVDGSVLNPIPIAPTISDDTDLCIAVNLNASVTKEYKIDIPKKAHKEKQKKQKMFSKLVQKVEHLLSRETKSKFDQMGMFNIMINSIDTMQKTLTKYKMAGYSPDIVINIPNGACNFYEFNRAEEMIKLGKIITKEKLRGNNYV